MLNIHITNKAKVQVIDNRSTQNQLIFRTRLMVPGFSCYSSPAIFVQPGKYTYNSNGMSCLLSIHRAINQEFIDEHGEFIITVGKSFLKLSHKQQLCALLYVCYLAELPAIPGSSIMLAEHIIEEEFTRKSKFDMDSLLSNRDIGGMEFIRDNSAIELVLGSIFGSRIINGVVKLIRKSIMHDLKVLQKVAHNTLKAEGTAYKGKTYKDDCKIFNKQVKTSFKDMVKSEKATAKLAKKMAKAAGVCTDEIEADLDAMAAEMFDDLADIKERTDETIAVAEDAIQEMQEIRKKVKENAAIVKEDKGSEAKGKDVPKKVSEKKESKQNDEGGATPEPNPA